jgi:Protein of unknown function (DUF3224)
MPIVSGVLDVNYTDERYDERAGTQMSRRRLRKVFHGDIEGESAGEFLMAVAPGGSAAYVGIDGVTVTIRAVAGSFVLVHSATRSTDSESAQIVVLAGSATDQLAGLRGTLTIGIEPDGTHTYTFNYELDDA